MPTIVSVGSITIVDVNDGAPGPAVVVTGNRPLSFTATDGVLDPAQSNIVLTAEVFGLASATYVWTFLGFETSPVSSGTSVQTVTMAQFGTSRAASVTCTVNGVYVSQVTIVRAERSTADAGATVGADSSNLKSGPGVNMVFNGDYTDGLAGTVVGWRSGGNQHLLLWNLQNYTVQGEGTACIVQPGTPGAGVLFYADIWNGQRGQHFAVTPGKKYEISAWLNCHRCEGRMIVLFLDAAGAIIQESTGNAVTHGSSITSIADMRQSWAIATAPATAVKALLIVRGYNTGLSDPYVFFSRVYFGEAGAGQTEPSLWTPGRGISQITPSNVSTYIANAAIGNAQIGGNLWSTNWNYAGGSGWLLDRNGNFYGNNIYARGDIEASSLKANTAMVNRANIVNAAVDTLQLAGNAVTIPVSASGTTSCQTASTSFESAPVAVVMAVVAQLSMSGTNALGTPITAYASLYRGTSLIRRIEINKAMYSPDSAVNVLATGTWVLQDTPGPSTTYYQVVLSVVGGNSSVLSTSTCSVLALGVKR